MKTWLLEVLLVVAIIATTTNGCYDNCFCDLGVTMYCRQRGLNQPPSGSWPKKVYLDLPKNEISVLYKYAFTGFSILYRLDLESNALTAFDLDVVSHISTLAMLKLGNNKISSFKATGGVRLEKLHWIYLQNNNLAWFNPDVFSAAPNLDVLNLSHNPIVVQDGQPVLNHPTITWLDMKYTTSLGALGEKSFSELPNVQTLLLTSAGITGVNGAFATNSALQDIYLEDNNITELKAGTFAENAALKTVYLDRNPLAELELSAVSDVIRSDGSLTFADTQLACECGYENIYQWAKGKGVYMYAKCNYVDLCNYT